MNKPDYKTLRFGRFALDLERGCLRAGDQYVDLRPKSFEVLRHLVENAGRLVSKEEFFTTIWRNLVVSDDSLVQCIRELRQTLGDDQHRLIKTLPRRGYLLTPPFRLIKRAQDRLPDRPRAAPRARKNSRGSLYQTMRLRRGGLICRGVNASTQPCCARI